MEYNPSFSFVMPAYKRQFLQQSIESILKQTYTNLELVVVDDASPENLYEVVRQFDDRRLRYERNPENIGAGDLVANWNHCLQFAKGEFVILATDDDVLHANYLADAVRLLRCHPEVDIVRQGVRKVDAEGNCLEYELFLPEYLSASEFAYFWGCCGVISCIPCCIFRRSALLQRGGFVSFPAAHFSDVATALALSPHGVTCVQAWNVDFRMSSANLSNRNDSPLVLAQIESTLRFMDWLHDFLRNVDDGSPGRILSAHAFQGFRRQYLYMMQNLLAKIPCRWFLRRLSFACRSPYAYKKERLRWLLGI